MEEEVLTGGHENVGSVVRIRDTIRRPRRPGFEVVEALLVHLEAVGYDGSPRFLGIDECGRQVLSYIEGEARDPAPWQADDVINAAHLGRIADRLKQLHRATASFVPPPDAAPRRPLPHSGTAWTHGDVGYSNIVYQGEQLTGLIDWEFAAPGHRCADLAALLAMSVRAPKIGAPDNERRARALRLALESVSASYGIGDDERAMLPRMAAAVIDDALAFWSTSSSQTDVEAWAWRAAWFRNNAVD